ncbi:Alpha/Beta hydrolase protein [Echria macrotheca]|uniref:Alpha/Beta hydrolase protein n=1 Tax=Echria macrotheca TaxID=438768 RepID=A0AAJ0FCJ3_9PEZI|nr:Alpha/Beta hydrolase protein [Echria macrotheca]
MCDFSGHEQPSAEWLALESQIPPPPFSPSDTVEEKQAAGNAYREKNAAEAMKTLGPWVQTQDFTIPTRGGSTVEARTYRPTGVNPSDGPLPVYLHLHGGGWLFGTLAGEDATCARIAINARVVVLNVNYRHTPAHVYPTAWNDTEDAFRWLHENIAAIGGDAKRVVVGGISAGGYLTASLVLQQHLGKAAASLPRIAGQVLLIPSLSNMQCYRYQLEHLKDESIWSWNTCKDAPILPRSMCEMFMGLLKVGEADPADARMNPGLARPEQVRGLPPTVFGIAGRDPLRDEGLLYAKKLADAGVATDVHMFSGLPHAFRQYGDKLSESKRWDRVIEEGILWTLSEPVAGGFEIKTQ